MILFYGNELSINMPQLMTLDSFYLSFTHLPFIKINALEKTFSLKCVRGSMGKSLEEVKPSKFTDQKPSTQIYN